MSKIPCPNPVCSHDFALSQIQKAGGALTCPGCGQSFNFGGATPTMPAGKPSAPKPPARSETPPAAKPTGASWLTGAAKPKSSSPPSVAKPRPTPVPPAAPKPARADRAKPRDAAPSSKIKTSVPLAMPIENDTTPAADLGEDFFNPAAVSGPLIRSFGSSGRSGWTWPKFAIIGIVGGILFALAYQFVPYFYRQLNPAAARGTAFTGQLRNLKGGRERFVRVTVPAGGWKVDEFSDARFNLKEHLAAELAFVNETRGREGWFAIAAKDYGSQLPTPRELQSEAIERLRFLNQFEFNTATPIDFLEEKALSVPFRGFIGEVQWSGECVTFGYQGFGYWFYFAAPQDEEAKALREDLAQRMQLTTDRTGWRPRDLEIDRFVSNSKRVTIEAPKDRWSRHDPAEELDKGDMELHTKKPKESKGDIKNIAVITVLMLERGGNLEETLKLTQDYLQSKQAAEFKFEPEGASRMEEMAERKALTREFRLVSGGESLKSYAITVAHDNDRAFAVCCECGFIYKDLWTADFKEVLARIRIGPPE